jgi:hypothetical protein
MSFAHLENRKSYMAANKETNFSQTLHAKLALTHLSSLGFQTDP